MGVHLNDNNITIDYDFMLELMDILALDLNDLPSSINEFSDLEK